MRYFERKRGVRLWGLLGGLACWGVLLVAVAGSAPGQVGAPTCGASAPPAAPAASTPVESVPGVPASPAALGAIQSAPAGSVPVAPDAGAATPGAGGPGTPAAAGGRIRGSAKAGAVALPGVAITAANTLTGKKYATTTDVTGAYEMAIPRNGRYVVRAELAAFASDTKEVLINAAGENGGLPVQVAEFGMQLASRVAEAAAAGEAQTARVAGAVGRGMQALSLSGGDQSAADASAGAGNAGAQMPTIAGLGGDVAATESVTVSGVAGQTNGLASFSEDEIRQRIGDAVAQMRAQGGGAGGDPTNAIVSALGGMMAGGGFGGTGGGGFGSGGFGGPGGGGRGGGGFGGFRNFNPTQTHGSLFYSGDQSALDAAPFSVSGRPVSNPGYSRNSYGATLAGSPYVPGLTKPSAKQFVFLNVTGAKNTSPEVLNGTVPTALERGIVTDANGNPVLDGNGNFTFTDPNFSRSTQVVNGMALPVTLYNPLVAGKPMFAGGTIPSADVSPEARALLRYYPLPNVSAPGTQGYNYQTVTTAGSNTTNASLRFVRNFGATPIGGSGGGRGGGGQGGRAPAGLRQNINFSGSYTHAASDQRNIFLPLGGATTSTGYSISGGYTIGRGRFTDSASLTWNRSHATTRNYFTNLGTDPGLAAGVLVGTPAIQANPFFASVPSLSFTNFTGLGNATPSENVNQTISLSDFVSYRHKKHNMRFGGDVRRLHADSIGGTNVQGAFTFTGYATEAPGTSTTTMQAPSGSGFADFLLGLPQQTSVQAGLNKTYLRENIFDWYAQDDYRVTGSTTLNFGLRYEYFGPYTEKNDRLSNLDHNVDFTAIAAVLPGHTGAFSGRFPRSLVNPDRTMYSPRFGFAYRVPEKVKAFKQTVMRGGYGLNFNTGQFGRFAQLLAFQPPFAITQTNIVGQQGCTSANLTLANGFGCSTVATQNNFGVDLNYRLGHVQIYNLGLQRTLAQGIVVNVDYNGSKGGELDIVRAPNRTATGLLTTTSQPFNYEDSLGFSRQNALAISVRKRQTKGISIQATYQYGHSIDDASSIGGGGTVVAQNDKDLVAEESNSAFDVRHRVTGNWVLELPFGPNRAFLSKGGFWSKTLDGFNLSGNYTFATGSYFSPRYVGTVGETATGANNSLRPDRNFGVPIAGAGSLRSWFNRAAFSAPANGFGTASRNSIEGPGTVSVNSALSRTFDFGETRSLEARVTAANVFNTVQYSGIDTVLNSATFGQVTGAAARRTVQVTARYRF